MIQYKTNVIQWYLQDIGAWQVKNLKTQTSTENHPYIRKYCKTIIYQTMLTLRLQIHALYPVSHLQFALPF